MVDPARQLVSDTEYFGIKSFLPLEKMNRQAQAWAQQYRDNWPFPHIGIDDFFDQDIISRLIACYPGEFDASWNRTFLDAGAYEEQKLGLDRLEDFPPHIQQFINALNSRLFLGFLERLTGIEGLIPDPYLLGGGLHMIPRGGRLAIHADFNIHKKLRLDRRLNLLLYLNYDWKEEW
ncbi:2OG-Fe(II) oxygenase, partial [Bradyrhizobium hipponense]